MTVVSGAMIAGYNLIIQGEYRGALAAAFACWLGYISAHYIATGKAVDRSPTISHPDTYQKTVIVVGVIVFLTGFTSIPYTIHQGISIPSLASFLTMFSGYSIIHYAIADSLL